MPSSLLVRLSFPMWVPLRQPASSSTSSLVITHSSAPSRNSHLSFYIDYGTVHYVEPCPILGPVDSRDPSANARTRIGLCKSQQASF